MEHQEPEADAVELDEPHAPLPDTSESEGAGGADTGAASLMTRVEELFTHLLARVEAVEHSVAHVAAQAQADPLVQVAEKAAEATPIGRQVEGDINQVLRESEKLVGVIPTPTIPRFATPAEPGQAVPDTAGVPHTTPPPAPAGGTAQQKLQVAREQHPAAPHTAPAPATAVNLPVPAWSQRVQDGPDDTGRDLFATTDCGEQAVCMVTYSAHRIEIDEGLVRGFISQHYTDMQDGRTTADMLVWYLSSRHNNCPHAHVVTGDGPLVVETIKRELLDGCPVLVLGGWYQGTLHWEVARGYDQQHVITCDPWDGQSKATTWTDYLSRVDHGTLVVTRALARYE